MYYTSLLLENRSSEVSCWLNAFGSSTKQVLINLNLNCLMLLVPTKLSILVDLFLFICAYVW